MSLDPSPLSSNPTPLLNPSDPAPGRGAALLGAIISVGLAIAVALVSMRSGTSLLFFAASLKAGVRAQVASHPYQIQGVDYIWQRSFGDQTTGSLAYGYAASSVSGKIFASEAQDFHMNTVIITITADVSTTDSTNVWYSGAPDIYPDQTYVALAQQAMSVGLTPIFRLALSVQQGPNGDNWPGNIGDTWINDNSSGTVGSEELWIDSYTAFAIHYARLAQSLAMPFIIVGTDLEQMTTESPSTAKGSPGAHPPTGEHYQCAGRRDCEWRHVINSVRSTGTYRPYTSRKALAGGDYSGKIIYEATSRTDVLSYFEWDPHYLTWWDAVDIIGIDAGFKLTTSTTPPVQGVVDAWHGVNTHQAGLAAPQNGNLVERLRLLSEQYNRNILFTSAGYESAGGANNDPGYATSTTPDQDEQLNDVTALLQTFEPEPWWLGVVWTSDYPVWPRSQLASVPNITMHLAEPDWPINMEWAGDCMSGCANPAKEAGLFFQQHYQIAPLPVNIAPPGSSGSS